MLTENRNGSMPKMAENMQERKSLSIGLCYCRGNEPQELKGAIVTLKLICLHPFHAHNMETL